MDSDEKTAAGWHLSDLAMEAFERGDQSEGKRLMDEANRLRAEALCAQLAGASGAWLREYERPAREAVAARLRETR